MGKGQTGTERYRIEARERHSNQYRTRLRLKRESAGEAVQIARQNADVSSELHRGLSYFPNASGRLRVQLERIGTQPICHNSFNGRPTSTFGQRTHTHSKGGRHLAVWNTRNGQEHIRPLLGTRARLRPLRPRVLSSRLTTPRIERYVGRQPLGFRSATSPTSRPGCPRLGFSRLLS